MSASREKKNRLNKPEVVNTEAPKKAMSKCLKRTLTIVITIVVVAAIVFLGMVSTGFFQKHTTAAVVNGHKLTPAMLNYFYGNAYTNLKDVMNIDTEKPLREQEAFGFDMNMEDYVMEYAVDSANNIYALHDAAIEAGFELSEEEKANIDAEIQMMDMYAQLYGLSNAESMLVSQYGIGSTVKSYREYLEVSQLASAYATSIQEGFTYTAEDLNAYYEENSEQFQTATFRQFSVTPETLHVEKDEAGLKACEEAANTVAAAAEQGEMAFLESILTVLPADHAAEYDAETATLRSEVSYSSFAEVYKEWLTDESRQEGDVYNVKNGENGYIVLYFIAHDDSNFLMPNVRHILISASDTTDEAAMAEAKTTAEGILEDYLAGEQTEEAFAELAKEHSADNAEEGGLYEDITPGSMVESFDAWCYDEARQIGDTGIVETEFGYHIMYFVGYGRSYRDYTIETNLRYEDYTEWYDALVANNEQTFNEKAKRYLMDM